MAHPALRLRLRPALTAAAVACLSLVAAGCGLKGALTMPTQSEEIVIRPAPGATPEGAGATDAAPAEAQPTTTPAEKKIKAPDDRLPPPPLPGGNPGTSRSG